MLINKDVEELVLFFCLRSLYLDLLFIVIIGHYLDILKEFHCILLINIMLERECK